MEGVMSEYSQGVCHDGAAILKDGQQLSIDDILSELRRAERLRAALSGSAISAIQEGWKVVPVEPTESMMRDAADNLCGRFGKDYVAPKEDFARAVWEELVAAAPEPKP